LAATILGKIACREKPSGFRVSNFNIAKKLRDYIGAEWVSVGFAFDKDCAGLVLTSG